MSLSPNVFRPSFEHGVDNAAGAQLRLAECLRLRSEEDAVARNTEALVKAQQSGSLAVEGAAEQQSGIPEQRTARVVEVVY